MATLYINCSSGLSGDMMLGAFVDLGVPESVLAGELDSLGLQEFRLEVTRRQRAGFSCTDVDVVLLDAENAWKHPYSGKYRNYGEIKEMIGHSSLSENVKSISRRIFDIKAGAEAKVHGVPVDAVQFHEAGAVDSIVDIVGTAICYDYLAIHHVISCHVPTGYGTVFCACGELPVPAPAVKVILEETGIPHYRSDVERELLTPTGAAILAGIVDEFREAVDFPDEIRMSDSQDEPQVPGFPDGSRPPEPCRRGYGSGKRDTGLPPLGLCLAAGDS